MDDVTFRTHGPLLDGEAPGIIKRLDHELGEKVSDAGVDMVKAFLDNVLKHPTGYYRSRVTQNSGRISDSNVVYGPWLEGVGSRNQRSRFKGYATFRKVTQQLQNRASDVADDVLPRYVRELNG